MLDLKSRARAPFTDGFESAEAGRDRELLRVIDHLYAAALDPSRWSDFLVAAAALFEADLGVTHAMLGMLPAQGRLTHHDFGIARGPLGRPLTSDDCERLNQLMPHLTRAFEIRRALAAQPAPSAEVTAPAKASHAGDAGARQLQTKFALSASHARLAMLLFEGRSVKDAATELGLTEGSARQYLKQIFRKTGVGRQLDLVRLIGEMLGGSE